MWWNILPGAIIICSCLAIPSLIVAPISHWLFVRNIYRRSLNTVNDRRQYMRDQRLNGNPYKVWGLEQIPDAKHGGKGGGEGGEEEMDEETELERCKKLLEAQALEDALNREKCPEVLVAEGGERVCKKDKHSEALDTKQKEEEKKTVEPDDSPKKPVKKRKCDQPPQEEDSGSVVIGESTDTCKKKKAPADLSDVNADPAEHSVDVIEIDSKEHRVDVVKEVQPVTYADDRKTSTRLSDVRADPKKDNVQKHEVNLEEPHVDTVKDVKPVGDLRKKCKQKGEVGEDGAPARLGPITKCEKFNVDEPVELTDLTAEEAAEIKEEKKCKAAPFVPPREGSKTCRKKQEEGEEEVVKVVDYQDDSKEKCKKHESTGSSKSVDIDDSTKKCPKRAAK